ncbi:MAG: FtsW/RodA/SpoVE family cell cycle protein, partial [Mycobacteriales bacterium]
MDLTVGAPRPRTGGRARDLTRLLRVDGWLVGAVAVLVAIGMVSVYAATRNHLVATGRPGTAYLERDAVNLLVGLVLAAPVARLDYRQLPNWAPPLYLGLCALLLAVLTPLGTSVNGAHGWFALGPVQLEPSEFMKLGVILLLASLLSSSRLLDEGVSGGDVARVLTAAAVPMALILAEPALGIALVVAVIAVAVLALAGAPARWLAVLVVGAVLAGTAALSLHLLKPYQEQRFTYLAHPDARSTSTAYQIDQSEIAIGSGGLLGQGLLRGSQTDGGFIPEQQTDFVFTVSAEEGGLLAGAALLAALGVLLLRGIAISAAAPDLFGRLVAGGVVAWLMFQSFVNVGMTLGIMPVTGL